MAVTIIDEAQIRDMLANSINMAIKDIAEEQLKIAEENIRNELAKKMDMLALKILSYYEVEKNGFRTIITVKKLEKDVEL